MLGGQAIGVERAVDLEEVAKLLFADVRDPGLRQRDQVVRLAIRAWYTQSITGTNASPPKNTASVAPRRAERSKPPPTSSAMRPGGFPIFP